MIIVVDNEGRFTGTTYNEFSQSYVEHHAQYGEHVIEIDGFVSPGCLVSDWQEGLARTVRKQRASLLAACDWTQLPDAPVDKAAWATYRQALRDITEQDGFPLTVEWPSLPTG
jgi:hypothetical protein